MHDQILKPTTIGFLLVLVILPITFAKLGEPCKFHENCGSFDKFLYCKKTDIKSVNGTCACGVTSPLEVEVSSVTTPPSDPSSCPKWRENGQSCLNTFECNPRLSLSCIQGICQCQPEQITSKEEYDDYNRIERRVLKGACLSKLDSKCDVTEKFRAHLYDTQCVPGASCSAVDNGTCKCNEHYGFEPTTMGFCGIGYDRECSESPSKFCWDRFRCSSPRVGERSRCKCLHPDYQHFDTRTESCRSSLDTPCDPNDPNGCIPLAECVQRDKTFPWTCQCRNGTVTTSEGSCEISAGFPCEYHSGESDYSKISCSTEANLVCKGDLKGDFKCACKNDGDLIEPEVNRCVKPVGVKCSRNECGMNAECKVPPGRPWGTCQCQSGYSAWNGRCGR